MLTTLLKNVTANWVGLVVNIVLSFIIAPVTVNALGSVYYGIWTLLLQFTGYLWLADLGVRESVVKYVAQYHASGQKDELVATVRTALSVYGLVAAGAMVLVTGLTVAMPYAFNIPPEAVTSARIAAFLTGSTIAQSFVFNVFVGVVMGLQLGYRLAPVNLGFSLFRFVLVYFLMTHGFGLVTLAVVQAVMSAAYSLLVYRLCRSALPYLAFGFLIPSRPDVARLYHYGKYVLITNIGEKIIFSTDSMVLAAFQPVAALTYYAIGGSLVEYLRSFIASMGSLINPVASDLEARRDLGLLADVVVASSKAAVLLGLPVCIGFMLLGERFISLWMGPSYGPQAGTVLRVLAAGYAIGLPFSTISATLYGLGQHHHVAYARVVEGVINLSISIVLVRQMGPIGVAIGTAIPQALSVGLYLPTVLPRLLPLGLGSYYTWTYLRPAVAALPFVAACWAIDRVLRPDNLLAFAGLGLAAMPLYAVPTWFIALTPSERERVITVLGRVRRRLSSASMAHAAANTKGAE